MSEETQKYPPERLAELPYVNMDEEGEPDDDWELQSQFTKPWYVEVSDRKLGVSWAFGPQGHPGSLHIYLNLFDQEHFQPRFQVLGPDGETRNRHQFYGPFTSSRYLKALLIYGHRLEERFGHDSYWHCCGGNRCAGGYLNRGGVKPPYQRCPDCAALSARAQEEVRQWVAENPFPKPPESSMPQK